MSKTKEYIKTGKYHIKNQTECQDVVYKKETDMFRMIALADGATPCENGRRGAEISCRTVLDLFEEVGDSLEEFSEEKVSALLLEQIRFRLEREAKREGKEIASYASTLVFACYNKKNGMVTAFSLGDSGIFQTDKKTCHAMLLPTVKNVNTGAFTTGYDRLAKSRMKRKQAREMETIWLCSDGILNEMRDWKTEKELKKAMAEKDWDRVGKIIDNLDNIDDCSFIAMEIEGKI